MKYSKIVNSLIIIIFLSILSCSHEQKTKIENPNSKVNNVKTTQKMEEVDNSNYNPNTVNDELALRIKEYLNTDEDFNYPEDEERRTFQLYEIDLNNDGTNEVFVILLNTSFCGNSGCAVLLLNSDMTLNTKFSTVQIPIYIEKANGNNWATLKIYDYGRLRELKYKGRYPSNPSAAPAAANNQPSSDAIMIFGEKNRAERKFYNY